MKTQIVICQHGKLGLLFQLDLERLVAVYMGVLPCLTEEISWKVLLKNMDGYFFSFLLQYLVESYLWLSKYCWVQEGINFEKDEKY